MRTEPAAFEPGNVLYDPATARVGAYQGLTGPRALLRPLGGGREWEAEPAGLRRATDRERIGAGLRAANERTHARPPDPGPLCRPPPPVTGCEVCAGLAERREAARAAFDHSAVTDTNVLLRQHQHEEHEE
ncbi:hypothetical protein Q3A86_16170 [Streptomyces sp. NBUA17]|uniref:hypothetical protein n=1 Tax=Streptomyces sp. NBUA17 TaxID=3062275 RepID=UPI0037D9DA1A